MRIKTFNALTLKVLSVSEITEKQMTEELTRD